MKDVVTVLANRAIREKLRDQPHHCHAIGCLVKIAPELFMCPRHWRMVPKTVQRAIQQHYRRGQCEDKQPSRAWVSAALAARRIVQRKESMGGERLWCPTL